MLKMGLMMMMMMIMMMMAVCFVQIYINVPGGGGGGRGGGVRGYSGFQVTGMIEWGQKSKPNKILKASYNPP